MAAAQNSQTAIAAGRIFDGEQFLYDQAVIVENGLVTQVLPEGQVPGAARYPDSTLVPGFVDVQVNGGGGVLFNDSPTVEGIRAIMAAHRRFGTTSLLPTLISDRWEVIMQAASAIESALQQQVPGIRGIHFEGPYLSTARKGVHDAGALRHPDADALALFTSGNLGTVVVTLAPERVDLEFISQLASKRVRVCLGHSEASYEQAAAALSAGASGFTHLFNAMTPLSSRAPGMVGAALDDPSSYCGIIADGHHVHEASLRVAIRVKPRGKVLLVTDAMPCVGTHAQSFRLGSEHVRVEQGRCTTASGTLAGSALNMAAAVRYTTDALGLPLAEALRMASLYPAAFLRLDGQIGRIRPGFAADFALLDRELRVETTWIGGQPPD